MADLRLRCPAKINLRLYIQGRRQDGYHELKLDFFPIDLFDEITFGLRESGGLTIAGAERLGLPENNLIIKAARALERETKQAFHLHFDLTKRIPSAAGLGGGSSNAAAVLVGLKKLYNLTIDLAPIATRLGADVPFFLDPKPCIATGIGEFLTPLPFERELPLLLFKPNFSISTPEAYGLCVKSRRDLTEADYIDSAIERLTTEDNDFFRPLSVNYHELLRAKAALKMLSPTAVQMSGSGSTMFAIFKDTQARDEAFEAFDATGGRAYKVKTLLRHSYF